MPFDFGSMIDVKETEQGQAVATTQFDFGSMEDVQTISPAPQSPLSKVVRDITKYTPAEQAFILRFPSRRTLNASLPT